MTSAISGSPYCISDQHATAVVVLAALINACRVTGKCFADLQVVIAGAGASGTAIARLLKCVGMGSDICRPVADLIICDQSGIIYRGRPDTFDTPHKYLLAHETNSENRQGDLGDALVGADAFVGVAAPGILTGKMVRSMGRDPIVFALANPEPEIEPADAIRAGAGIIGTGKNTFPHQCNYVLAFPGIFRGALDVRATRITAGVLIAAARALAGTVTAPRKDRILPSILNSRVTARVAFAVREAIVREGCVRG